MSNFLGSLVCVASLIVLALPSGAAGGGTPNEHTAGAAERLQGQPVQPADEGTVGQSSDPDGDHEALPVPLNREFPEEGAVELVADSAHIVIRWDADPNPAHVRAQWSLDGPSGDILLSSRGRNSVLRYVPDPTIEGYPVIELHLAQTQHAVIFGSSLSVDALTTSLDVAHQSENPAEPSTASQLEIDVVRSDLTLTDIPNLTVKAEETTLFASGGTGTWIIDANGGNSELTDHRGTVNFTGQRAEAAFEGIGGALTIDTSESAVFVREGAASIVATASGGSVDCEETNGTLSISGASTSITLRRVRSSRLTLDGDDLYVIMEGGQGSARAALKRGHFSISGWASRIDLTTRDGATATVRDLDGDIAFDAADGASVGIFGVTGHVRGRVTGSVFEASSLKSIELHAQDSDITLQETRTLKAFDLTDSTASLNLYELRGEPVISLHGSSRADIDLHYPCQVRAEGPGAVNSGRLSVDGCENLRPGQSWTRPRAQRRGEKPVEPIHLSIKMDQRADVSVRGY